MHLHFDVRFLLPCCTTQSPGREPVAVVNDGSGSSLEDDGGRIGGIGTAERNRDVSLSNDPIQK